LNNWCVWLVIEKKFFTMHGNMNVKSVHSFPFRSDCTGITMQRQSLQFLPSHGRMKLSQNRWLSLASRWNHN
jgi:hypothetical protein